MTTPSTLAAGTPSRSVQMLLQDDIKHVMTSYQRAAVLAERGKHWTLLQNVARSLWNAVSALLTAISKLPKARREYSSAMVYGLACKPLYFVADGLGVLLEDCGFGIESGPFPLASSLAFTPWMDDVNGVGMAAIRRVVFLAIHTLYLHQHWEKVVALGLLFDDVTK